MTNSVNKLFLFLLFMALPVSALGTEIGSITYGTYVILYEGTENSIFKGTTFDVYRGTEKIGELLITDSYSTNSKGMFSPDLEKYLPIKTSDRLLAKEKVVINKTPVEPIVVKPKIPSTGLIALSPTPVITQGYAIAMEYNRMGTVGRISALNHEVNANGMNISVSYGQKTLQARYTRRAYNAEDVSPTATNALKAAGDVLDIKYKPGNIKIPWNGNIALGAYYYINGNQEFTQPYGVFSTNFENIDVNAGVNSVFGDVLYKNGFFISAGYKITPELSLFVDYSSVDANKSIVNSLILPQAKIWCSACSLDSTSLGLIYKFSPNMNILLAMYDMNDLNSFFSSVSYEMTVGKKHIEDIRTIK